MSPLHAFKRSPPGVGQRDLRPPTARGSHATLPQWVIESRSVTSISPPTVMTFSTDMRVSQHLLRLGWHLRHDRRLDASLGCGHIWVGRVRVCSRDELHDPWLVGSESWY